MALGPLLAALLLATTLAPAADGVAQTCAGLSPTIVGTPEDDHLVGTPGPDVIVGSRGQDLIDGGDGDDVICGDAGADTLLGGNGNDRLYGGDNGLVPQFESGPSPGRDEIAPGPGDDLVDLGLNTHRGYRTYIYDLVNFSDSLTGVAVDLVAGTATGEGSDQLVVPVARTGDSYMVEVEGSSHADVLMGTERADVLIGNGGGDRVEGRGGDDLLMEKWDEGTYDSDDVYDGGAGDDFTSSGGGDDVSRGGPGRDWVRDETGSVEADGGDGHDVLEVYFTPGVHTVTGGAGRDRVTFGVVFEGRRYDRIRGTVDTKRELISVRMPDGTRWSATLQSVRTVNLPGGGRWVFRGSSAGEVVTGGGAFTAYGRGGDDRLRGSVEDDLLFGGRGMDEARGGPGEDTCRAEDERACER
jgi:Ca2+-binding RTX toxin-like protein